MNIKKSTKIIFAVFTSIVLFLIFGTPRYQSMKIKSISLEELQSKLKEAVNREPEVDISKLTNFKWDECYVFHPYYPAKDIYEKVGIEWTECKTYLGYLFFHGIENETVNDGQYLIVFKKDNKVVLSEIYDVRELPVIFKLDNFKFTNDKGIFIVSEPERYKHIKEINVKELILKN